MSTTLRKDYFVFFVCLFFKLLAFINKNWEQLSITFKTLKNKHQGL